MSSQCLFGSNAAVCVCVLKVCVYFTSRCVCVRVCERCVCACHTHSRTRVHTRFGGMRAAVFACVCEKDAAFFACVRV